MTDKTSGAEASKEPRKSFIIPYVNRLLTVVDDVILIWVALGIIGVAFLLMLEALTDFIHYTEHSISHIISDLMFVLIIMELFRQLNEQGTTIVQVTHSEVNASYGHRIINLADGWLVKE